MIVDACKTIIKEIVQRFKSFDAELPIKLEVFIQPGMLTRDMAVRKKISVVGESAVHSQNENSGDGDVGAAILAVGDLIKVAVSSPRDGWLNLYNLGSGGTVQHLVPANVKDGGVFLKAGETFVVNQTSWKEGGPRTCETGLPETFLAVVTETRFIIKLSDLHILLAGQENYIGMRGGFGEVKERKGVPFCLPVEEWGYSILQLDVK
jgi:hypothetical protein